MAGELPGEEEPLPLCRLRFKNEDNLLPTGLPIGSPEDRMDCACYLCLGDQSA